jgi:hypothetical protein
MGIRIKREDMDGSCLTSQRRKLDIEASPTGLTLRRPSFLTIKTGEKYVSNT